MKKLFSTCGWTLGVILGATFFGGQAQALTNFQPGNLSTMTSGAVNDLLKTAAVGTSYRSYQPARALGLAIGVDVGVDVTAISVPSSFTSALSLATGQATTNIPSTIPLPRLNIHKGLPMGTDIGFSFVHYLSTYAIYGGEIQHTFLSGLAVPSLAVRFSGNYSKLYFLSTHAYAFDVVASKNFILFEPYLGAGVETWSGDLEVPLGGSTGLPLTISGHSSGTEPRFFGGLAFKLLVLKITGEMNYSTAGVTTYGAKVSFNL